MAEANETPTTTGDNGQRTGSKETVFDFSTSDFANIMKTTAFVDRSRMIKDVFSCSSKILVTAPRRFGKSTNIDMMKRFLEIEVDSEGSPMALHTTKNYRLFIGKNLEICKDGKFFNENFGKHPVIHIDFLPLSGVLDFENTVGAFRTIITNTFYQHNYFLHVNRQNVCLTDGFCTEDFRKFVSGRLIKDVGAEDLLNSFKYLSRMLYKYFEKQVFVLMDNYNVFVSSMPFKNCPDVDKTNYFKGKIIDNLLNDNMCVGRALLTATLPLTVDNKYALHGCNIDIYPFLGDHSLCKYYGLSSDYFDKILEKIIKSGAERDETKRTIDTYYSGYFTGNQRSHVYNIWSVLQYLRSRKVLSYWCGRERLQSVELFFKNSQIRRSIEMLLLGESQLVDTLHELSSSDISELNDVIGSGEIENLTRSVVRTFFAVLYHSGYLSISKVSSWRSAYLKIPNEEIKHELGRILVETNPTYYNCSQEDSDKVRSAVDLFRPDSTDQDKTFEIFFERIGNWYLLQKENDFPVLLFMIFLTSPEYSRSVVRRTKPDGEMYILLKNKHGVAICIVTAQHKTSKGLWNCACNVHKCFTDNIDNEHVFDEFIADSRGKVLIAVAYSGFPRNIDIAYSYYFKEGDSLKNQITIANDTEESEERN